jgi:hypothetical protein
MSAVSRLPVMAGTMSLGAAIAAIATIPSLRERFAQYVGKTVSTNMLRALAIGLALVNIKNLPLVWHVRSILSRSLSEVLSVDHGPCSGGSSKV